MLSNCGTGEDSWESFGQERRSNQSIWKEISPEYSLEGLMLKLKLQYFVHLMWRTDTLKKVLKLGKTGQEENGTTEDEMTRWHDWLNGHEFEQTLGDSEDKEAWCAAVHSIAKKWTCLSYWTTTNTSILLWISVEGRPKTKQVQP